MQKRLDAARLLTGDSDLISLRYSDWGAGFYVETDEDIDGLLSDTELGKEWAFVELDQDEEDNFGTPESRLDCRMLNLYTDGTGVYTVYGKHTGEEYYTESIPLVEILKKMNKTN